VSELIQQQIVCLQNHMTLACCGSHLSNQGMIGASYEEEVSSLGTSDG
jgi:hypothetical protein